MSIALKAVAPCITRVTLLPEGHISIGRVYHAPGDVFITDKEQADLLINGKLAVKWEGR